MSLVDLVMPVAMISASKKPVSGSTPTFLKQDSKILATLWASWMVTLSLRRSLALASPNLMRASSCLAVTGTGLLESWPRVLRPT